MSLSPYQTEQLIGAQKQLNHPYWQMLVIEKFVLFFRQSEASIREQSSRSSPCVCGGFCDLQNCLLHSCDLHSLTTTTKALQQVRLCSNKTAEIVSFTLTTLTLIRLCIEYFKALILSTQTP